MTFIRRAWLALLLAILAAPALAQPQAKPAVPRNPAELSGPACATEHQAVIAEAFVIARERVEAGLALIRANPEHDHIRRWFGTTPPGEVSARLQATATWLDGSGGARLRCNDPPGCKSARMAYAAPYAKVLGVCPAFFRARMDGFDSRWGILVHEVTHLAAGTRDHAYGRRAAAVLAKDDPERAAQNADNYEYFLETLPR
jgi:peptidyl-Lys metalloendopeptidase